MATTAVKKTGNGSGLTPEQDQALRAKGWSAPIGERLEINKWDVGVSVTGQLLTKKKLPDNGEKKGGWIFSVALLDANDKPTDDRICYGAPTLLYEILEPVNLGTLLMIRCTGKIPTKRGQDAWTFDVRSKGQAELPF